MRNFKHVSAESVDEAVKILGESRGGATVMAGGTDLLGALKNGVRKTYPNTIIDIKTIPGLDYIEKDSGGLRIGGMTKLNDIVHSSLIGENCRVLAEAAKSIGSPQIRNMATIGGNLCQDVRCWFYRASPYIGVPYECLRKGGNRCYALTTENRYHSVFGAAKSQDPPCSEGCPGSIDIPRYMSKFREGDLRAAAGILLESNPMPAITGRVCPHFCEKGCVRNEFDEPLSIRSVERFLGDYILDHADEFIKPMGARTGKTAAILGAGPAGLAAAHYLMMSGHHVTVFDRMEEAGGMLFYGIPDYVLPREIVRKTVKVLVDAGVTFQFGIEVGQDLSIGDLQKRFDVTFLGPGAWGNSTLDIEGAALTSPALSYLINLNQGVKETLGNRILIIGGGNVAVDVALAASRQGAEEVTMICLESREEMPAFPWEIEKALEEGVQLMTSWGPSRVLESDGKVTGMEVVSCMSVFDEKGLFAPVFDNKIKKTIDADQVILAVGQKTDLSFLDPEISLETDRGLIVVDKETQATEARGVFAGGDVTSPPATVIDALAAGRRAAVAMDLHLEGKGIPTIVEPDNRKDTPLTFSSDCLQRTERAEDRTLPVDERRLDIEDTRGLGKKEVEEEAKRCFNCGCVAVSPSDLATVLTALNAELHVSGVKGLRTISMEDFLTPSGNSLEESEMVTEVHIPPSPEGAKQAFIKFRVREALDFALASVAVNITLRDGICEDARIVLGAVAPLPIRAVEAEEKLKGMPIEAAPAESAAEAALKDTFPLSDNGYKIELAKTLVKRAILSCKK